MDWESLYCPNRRCRYYGRPFLQGQLVKHGSSHGQKQARWVVYLSPADKYHRLTHRLLQG